MADRSAVVTCFLRHRGEVLLVRRATEASSYPGQWGAISGYVEDDDPVGTAASEIREETGFEIFELVREGEPFELHDASQGRTWRVFPFLFDVASREVVPNEEIAEFKWTSPTDLFRRDTVPALWTSYEHVAPSATSIATDDRHGSAYLSIRALEVLRDVAGRATNRDGPLEAVASEARELLAARPSMAALRNRVNRAMAQAMSAAEVEQAAIAGIDRAFDVDDRAAAKAAAVIADHGGSVFTLSRSGTVLEALREGAASIVVAESRPASEGVGVAEELAEADCDVRLCTDAAVAQLLATEAIDVVLVGADTILPDGAVSNKTGTRMAALAAHHEAIPFYVVASTDKVSTDAEVHLEAGDPRAVYDGPAAIEVSNPTFDMTPPALVTGYLTERGILGPHDLAAVVDELRELSSWRDDG